MTSRFTRRLFLLRAMAASVVAWVMGRPLVAEAAAEVGGQVLTHGPLLGDLTPSGVRVLARAAESGRYELVAHGAGAALTATAEAKPESDRTLHWKLSGLEPATRYRYEIQRDGRTIFSSPDAAFVTPAEQQLPQITRLAFGSCAREQEGDRAVWRRMAELAPHAVVLLGDTPYIDSTEIAVQRTRHGQFLAVQEYADMVRSHPLYATWDDHDFGANDTIGPLAGKENSRQVFIEYHANPSYGEGGEGIYTKFRMGGIEVFLLDTRYFGGIETSPIANGPTLLGRAQWEWLSEGLRSSDAPFKILASGLIWNGAVRPGKPDHWESYAEERDAIFRFIGDEGISGVVLMGGDIHRTRVLRYDTRATAGYPLTELITSPVHAGVIVEANAPHPALVHDSGEPHAFLLATVDTTVDPPTLHARFENAEGRELYSLTLTAAELTAA